MWAAAFLFISGFAGGILLRLAALGWLFPHELGVSPDGFAPVEISRPHAALGFLLMSAGHVAPRLLPQRRVVVRAATSFEEDGTYRAAPSRRFVALNAAQIDRADAGRSDIGVAWALASSLAVAFLGFHAQDGRTHAPRQHPLEWWSFFAASALTVASHAPRGGSAEVRGRWRVLASRRTIGNR